MSRTAKKNRRERLFKEHPYCYWCACELISAEEGAKQKPHPNNMATIDHRFGVLSPERKQSYNNDSKNESVLSCLKCNNDRGRQDQIDVGKEELRRRSKFHDRKKKRKHVKDYVYFAVLEKDENPGLSIFFPDFPGCTSAGDTKEEARKMAKEALELHIEDMIEDGEKIPNPSNPNAWKFEDDFEVAGIIKVPVSY